MSNCSLVNGVRKISGLLATLQRPSDAAQRGCFSVYLILGLSCGDRAQASAVVASADFPVSAGGSRQLRVACDPTFATDRLKPTSPQPDWSRTGHSDMSGAEPPPLVAWGIRGSHHLKPKSTAKAMNSSLVTVRKDGVEGAWPEPDLWAFRPQSGFEIHLGEVETPRYGGEHLRFHG